MMGLIANQMFIEMLCKVSQRVQNKKGQKKNCSMADKAAKKQEKKQ